MLLTLFPLTTITLSLHSQELQGAIAGPEILNTAEEQTELFQSYCQYSIFTKEFQTISLTINTEVFMKLSFTKGFLGLEPCPLLF